MRVSEVKPGMTGYGLSVFTGTKLEKFEVSVVSVLKNQMGPNQDIVLIKCSGQGLEHSGAVAGMSGSPIYLKDEQGRFRMIGAFALGWEFAKDPLAGVRPIEEMLRVSTYPKPTKPGADRAQAHSWDVKPLLNRSTVQSAPTAEESNSTFLKPLAVPISASGMDQRLFKSLSGHYSLGRFQFLQTGSVNVGNVPDDVKNAKLEPGAAIGVPIVSGDLDMSAIGTVTEVIGDRVFAFGHEFNAEGPVDLPMGVGYVHTIVANTNMSFKLGTMLRTDGTINSDESVAIAGLIGKSPATIPVEITVTTPQRPDPQTYKFNITRHNKFTVMGTMSAISAAVTGHSKLPPDFTINYNLHMEFDDSRKLDMKNRTTSLMQAMELIRDLSTPLQFGIENPFKETYPTKITGNFEIKDNIDASIIRSATSDKSIYKPGETVRLFLTSRPWHGEDETTSFQLKLPADLPDGPVTITLSDASRFNADEMRFSPFKFQADNIDDVFSLLGTMTSDRSDQLYIRLTLPGEGLSVGRTALGKLPSGKRSILMHDSRPEVVMYPESIIQKHVLDKPVIGAVDLQLVIAKDPTRAAKTPAMPMPGVMPIPNQPPQQQPQPGPQGAPGE